MKNFEFKSQICTSHSQSERLLTLGLKKETADMVYHYKNSRTETMQWELMPHPPVLRSNCHFNIERLNVLKQRTDGVVMSGEEYFDVLWGKDIPAWSLHRLVEMIPLDIWHTEYENGPRLKHTFWFCKHAPSYNSVENIDFRAHPNLYDNMIDCIEWLINEDYFNKDYLEEKK